MRGPQKRRFPVAALLMIPVVGCGGGGEGVGSAPSASYDWQLPPGFPEPYVPASNPMTAAKVALGRSLFFDPRLSANGTQACASCHDPEKAFTDGLVTPTGSTGDTLAHNAMGLANVAYLPVLTWANPLLETLEDQALVPMFGEHPVELQTYADTESILDRFRDDATYQVLFEAAFPGGPGEVTVGNVTRAIASFERTLLSGDSPYDRAVFRGEPAAMTESQVRGMDLFNSERTECYHCHAGTTFTSAFQSASSTHGEVSFENDGLYDVGGDGSYPPGDQGLYEITKDPLDRGKFRVPTLRNVARTAPYMHDGSMATLDDVLEHYRRGGRLIAEGPLAGDGKENPNKSPLVRGIAITDEEKADLRAFLEALTDEAFGRLPEQTSPFGE